MSETSEMFDRALNPFLSYRNQSIDVIGTSAMKELNTSLILIFFQMTLRKILENVFFEALEAFFKKACNFIKKESLAQVFSCEFCEIFKNTFFTEHFRTIASATLTVFRESFFMS